MAKSRRLGRTRPGRRSPTGDPPKLSAGPAWPTPLSVMPELEWALFGTELSFRSAPAARDNVPQGRRQTQVAISSYETREEPGGREVS